MSSLFRLVREATLAAMLSILSAMVTFLKDASSHEEMSSKKYLRTERASWLPEWS